MQLHKYKLRVKYERDDPDTGKKAYRTATVIAPGALVAVLWYQQFAHTKDLPIVEEKNGKGYDARTGNKTYRRAVRLKLAEKDRIKDEKLSAKRKKELNEKDERAKGEASLLFPMCSLIEEDVYVV